MKKFRKTHTLFNYLVSETRKRIKPDRHEEIKLYVDNNSEDRALLHLSCVFYSLAGNVFIDYMTGLEPFLKNKNGWKLVNKIFEEHELGDGANCLFHRIARHAVKKVIKEEKMS